MTSRIRTTLLAACLLAFASAAMAQSKDNAKDSSNSPLVTKMMAFDKNHDGKLTRDEITDPRLLRLFDEADANHDGVVTKDELAALAAKREVEFGADGGRGRGFGGPGGPGGPGGFGPRGGPGGPGGPPGGPPFGGPGFGGPPPAPGQVLPPMLQDMLNLTDDQRKQLAELQKDVDARLAKILTAEQLDQLKQMRPRGRRGGPGGPPPPEQQ